MLCSARDRPKHSLELASVEWKDKKVVRQTHASIQFTPNRTDDEDRGAPPPPHIQRISFICCRRARTKQTLMFFSDIYFTARVFTCGASRDDESAIKF